MRIMSGGRVYRSLRWRCAACGRLISESSVHTSRDFDSNTAEAMGECARCGLCDAYADWAEVS